MDSSVSCQIERRWMKHTKQPRVQKTNAMRELDTKGVSYTVQTYDAHNEDTSTGVGVRIAQSLGNEVDASFKTLVTTHGGSSYVVCCIPVNAELDLKKAAKVSQEKSLSMVHVKDLEALTGYIRGGCSPIGMKKEFYTIIDETALLFDLITISGGKRGITLKLNPRDLQTHFQFHFEDICHDALKA